MYEKIAKRRIGRAQSRACEHLSDSGFSGLAGFTGFHFAQPALFAANGNPAHRNMDKSLPVERTRWENPVNPDSDKMRAPPSPFKGNRICNRPRNGWQRIMLEILMRLGKPNSPTQELPPMPRIRFTPPSGQDIPGRKPRRSRGVAPAETRPKCPTVSGTVAFRADPPRQNQDSRDCGIDRIRGRAYSLYPARLSATARLSQPARACAIGCNSPRTPFHSASSRWLA